MYNALYHHVFQIKPKDKVNTQLKSSPFHFHKYIWLPHMLKSLNPYCVYCTLKTTSSPFRMMLPDRQMFIWNDGLPMHVFTKKYISYLEASNNAWWLHCQVQCLDVYKWLGLWLFNVLDRHKTLKKACGSLVHICYVISSMHWDSIVVRYTQSKWHMEGRKAAIYEEI